MKKRAIRILSAIMTCAMLLGIILVPAGAASVDCFADTSATVKNAPEATTPTPITLDPPLPAAPVLAPEDNTAVSYDAETLYGLARALRDAYYLEARVKTLVHYSTFNPAKGTFGGYFTFSNNVGIPVSIFDQLDRETQQQVQELSTYQAFQLVMATEKYQQDEQFHNLVNNQYGTFMAFMPTSVQQSLRGFIPSGVTAQLDPDQLCVVGKMIVNTEAYQDLKNAMRSPLMDCYSAAAVESHFSPAEITLLCDEIIRATLNLWGDSEAIMDLGLMHCFTPDGAMTIRLRPSSSTGG